MGGLTTSSLAVSRELVQYAAARKADPREIWGIPWPFAGLNKVTGGIHPERMTILQARPSVGKTVILSQVAESVCAYLASEQGKHEYPDHVVRLVLCEMTAAQFQQRLLCARARISERRLNAGTLSDEAMLRFRKAASEVGKWPIEYLDSSESLEQSAQFIRHGFDKSQRTCVWFGVDYLQIHPLNPREANDGGVVAVTRVSGTFRHLTKTVAPGLILSQMNRQADQREDKRPTMADLRGSGSIEADASLILGLFREDIYSRVPEETLWEMRPASLVINKNRYGTGSNRELPLAFNPKHGVFEDVSDVQDEPDMDEGES